MFVAGKRLHRKKSSASLTVYVNSVELEQVQSHKLLGVIIDTRLNFNEHIDNADTRANSVDLFRT